MDGQHPRVLQFRRYALVVFSSAVLIAACERPHELRVPMAYRPTDQLEVTNLNVGREVTVGVVVVDSRGDTAAVGANNEKAPTVPIYPTGDSPAEFLSRAVALELTKAGLSVETDIPRAAKLLTLTITKFWVEETDLYRATILTDVHVTDASRREIWQGVISGSSERFGRSLSAENYQESFSDASLALVQTLLRTPQFVEALKAPASPPARRRSPSSR